MLTISYWMGPSYNHHLEDRTGYEHNQQFENKELHHIIDNILNIGLNIKIQHIKNDNFIIYIDTERFQQR